MRTLLFPAIALGVGAVSVLAEDPRRIDVNNLFPSTGAYVIWVDPNNAGVPEGILVLGTGTLIHERVFLTCGHCTRASEPGIPPFIRVFVTFNLHVMDDPSAWIPVVAQSWHPSTLPCGPDNACHWPDEPFPRPGLSDVGLMFLAEPVNFVKPTKLPEPGMLERGRAEKQDQFLVGYLFPEGIRRYRVVSPAEVFDDRSAQGAPGEVCPSVAGFASGSMRFLGPLGNSGGKRRTVITSSSGFKGNDCTTGRSGLARIDNEDVQSWIAQQIQHFLASQK